MINKTGFAEQQDKCLKMPCAVFNFHGKFSYLISKVLLLEKMAQVTVGVLIEKQEQENRDQDTTDEISIKLLSDNELQEKLLMYGAEPGPILRTLQMNYGSGFYFPICS